MRIILATGIYPPESGGPATYTYGLAQALIEKGHHVTVAAYGDRVLPLTKGELEGVVHRVSRRGGPLLRYIRYAWKVFLLARQADLVYAQGGVSEGFPAGIAARISGRPLLVRIPGDYAWEMAQQKGRGELLDEFLKHRHHGLIGWYERMERWTVRQARRVIVPSRYLRSVVEQWGISPEHIEIIKSVSEPLPQMSDREDRRRSSDVADCVVCLTAVRAVPWKGVGELVRWWKEVPSTHVLIVAGDGPELARWKALAKEEGVEDRVRFLGRIDRHALAEWYQAADVFVLHTGYEGYPHVVAEAASLGLPCLVSDCGGNPETVEDFSGLVTILPYQDQEAWVKALSDVSRSALRAPTSMPLWTHAKMVETMEKILQETVEPSRGKIHTVMVSYDRELLDPSSSAFRRVSSFSGEGQAVDIIVMQGKIVKNVFQGIRLARRWPGRAVVTAQDPFAAGLVGYLISRWTNAPLEIQEHADYFSGAWARESWRHRVLSCLGRFLLRRAERVRVVSERVKTHLTSLGISASKIEVIPVAQDLESLFALPEREAVASPLQLIAPCRFVYQKGLDTLLDAMVHLKKSGRVLFHLSLIGSGPLESWLRKAITRRDLSSEVTIQPWQPQDILWKNADVLVMSSRYEGWGRTIIEAMAAGVSVVTTNVGCAESFLRPDVDGLIVPVGDASALAKAVEVLAHDPDQRAHMLDSARERAKTFPAREQLHDEQRYGWRSLLARKTEVGPRFDLWVAGFVLFAILSRAASVILFHTSLLNREWGFYTLVDHWFRGFGYSYPLEHGCASAYRSPGYLFFLTALYTFFRPENTWAQAIVQNIIVVGVLMLVYAVGKRLVGRRAALIGGFLMACYPYTFYHYTQYYHTFLSSFFLLLVVWFLLRLEETRQIRHAIGCGIAIAGLAYIQGTILPVTPFFVLWLAWQWWPDWKHAARAAIVMGLIAMAVIAPWTYRNWRVFHHFVPLTTDLGHAFFKANNEVIYELTKRGYPQEIVDEETVSSTDPNFKQYRLPPDLEAMLKRDGVFRDSIYWTEWHPKEPGLLTMCPRGTEMSEYDFNQYWLTKGEDWLRQNWWTEGWKLQLLKIKTFWQPNLFPSVKTGAPWSFGGSPFKVWLARNAVTAASALVIFGGWIGVFFALRRRDRRVWVPLVIFLIYTFLHTFFAGYTKYRMPLDNLLAVYAGWVIVRLWDFGRGKSSGTSV